MTVTDSQRLQSVIAAIDAANSEDPVRETDSDAGGEVPRALLYGQRMSRMLEEFAPGSGELARIAVRAQHIRRWTVPRGDYPEGRQGYRRWRTDLARYHAEVTGGLMAENGYSAEEIAHVGKLQRKEGLKSDPEAQLLEDVACLVFLRHYLADFVAAHGHKYDEAKLLGIIRKTWKKMSEAARGAALEQPLPESIKPVVLKALEDD